MKKIDSTVLRETTFIAVVSLLFSCLLQVVFLAIGQWDFTVLFGNLLGCGAAILNLFFMGYSIQISLEKSPENANKTMRLSQSLRLLFLFLVALCGYLIACFNVVAVVIPFLFPRVAVMIRALFPVD